MAELSPEKLARRHHERLPVPCEEALGHGEADRVIRGWFSVRFSEVFLARKRFEVGLMAGNSVAERCVACSGFANQFAVPPPAPQERSQRRACNGQDGAALHKGPDWRRWLGKARVEWR